MVTVARLCESALLFCRSDLRGFAEIAADQLYDFAVPGSATLRCCLASISFGVTLATVV